jgi:hypothetical protein
MNDLESLANWIINNQDKQGTEAYAAAVSALKELDAKKQQESQTPKINDVERQRLEQRLEDAKYAQSQGEDAAEEIKTVEAALGRSSEQSQPPEAKVVSQEPTPDQLERAKFQLVGGLGGTAAAIGSTGRGALSSIGQALGEGYARGLKGPTSGGASSGGPDAGSKWLTNYAKWEDVPDNVGGVPDATAMYQRRKNQGKISGRADKMFGVSKPGEPKAIWERWDPRTDFVDYVSRMFQTVSEDPIVRGGLGIARRVSMPAAGYEIFGDLYDVGKAMSNEKPSEAIIPSLKTAATLAAYRNPRLGIPAFLALKAYQNAKNNPETLQKIEEVARQPGLRFIR